MVADTASTTPRFFDKPIAFRKWLEANHHKRTELLVGFYKRDSGKPSITWPESVDEALCFGWIDGVRRSLGAEAYTIRFTPRKPRSIWSAINVAKMAELDKAGKLHASGRAVFALRTEARTGVYSFERAEEAVLPAELDKALRANRKASQFFDAQAPGYRRTALHWVVSAKREDTRSKRLARLIADSAAGQRLGHLVGPASKRKQAKP